MKHEEEILNITESLALAIEREVGHLRFKIDGSEKVNSTMWAIASIRRGYFLDSSWACDWIRHGYPDPPKQLMQ